MEKALEMGKISATGSFHLLVGVSASTIIMAVGTIILTRLMSPAEFGVYAIALIPSSTLNLFRDWGVNSAITKYIANFRMTNKDEEIHDVIVAGVIFEVGVGLILSSLSVVLAGFFASVIFHRPESTLYIAILSVTTISGALLAVAQSSFVGFERMQLNSLTIICQSIVKTMVGPILVVLGFSVLGAVLGYTLSMLTAGIIGVAILYFILFKPLRKHAHAQANNHNILGALKAMLKYGVPLSISSILGGILAQISSLIMASFVADTAIGNYQAAVNFSILLTFLTIPISTVLFPAFAKLNPRAESTLLRTVFTSSVKYTAVLLVPTIMAMMVLSGPMISTLFGERYVDASFFLTLYVSLNLFPVLGTLSAQSLLSGFGETKMLMKLGTLNLSIGLPFSFLLIPRFGIVGLILAGTFGSLPGNFWVLYWIWKHYGAKADFQSSARIIVASAMASVGSYFSISVLNAPNWMRLAVGLAIFLVIYLLATPLIDAVDLVDISNLRAMFSGIGFVSKLVDIPLRVVEKTLLIRNSSKKEKS